LFLLNREFNTNRERNNFNICDVKIEGNTFTTNKHRGTEVKMKRQSRDMRELLCSSRAVPDSYSW